MSFSVIVKPIADAKVAASGSTSKLRFEELTEAVKCYNKHLADIRANMWLFSELWMFASIEVSLYDDSKKRPIECTVVYSFN